MRKCGGAWRRASDGVHGLRTMIRRPGSSFRSRWIGVLLGLAGLVAFMPAHAQYPDRAARIIIPFAPGGGTDLVGRMIAAMLAERLGSPFIAENRAGAGGVIGAEFVARSAPDGYTLMMGTPGSMTINPAMLPNISYDPLRDFEPITRATTSHMALSVSKDLPVKSVRDLLVLAKAKPDFLSFGSSGIGSTAHLSAELFKMLGGVQMTHVPYKGTIPSVTDLAAGRIQVLIENLPAVAAFAKRGDIRLLAVGGTRRAASVPDIPTIAESGLPGYEATTWLGLFAPARTPRPIIEKLHATVAAGMSTPAITEKLDAMGFESTAAGTPEQLRTYLEAKLTEMRNLVKVTGLKPQ